MNITDGANEGGQYLAIVEDNAEPCSNRFERGEGV